jgi:hypothetical protein
MQAFRKLLSLPIFRSSSQPSLIGYQSENLRAGRPDDSAELAGAGDEMIWRLAHHAEIELSSPTNKSCQIFLNRSVRSQK